MQLDVESLRIFAAVLDEGGMTAAAEALGLSQSAVSWRIKRTACLRLRNCSVIGSLLEIKNKSPTFAVGNGTILKGSPSVRS